MKTIKEQVLEGLGMGKDRMYLAKDDIKTLNSYRDRHIDQEFMLAIDLAQEFTAKAIFEEIEDVECFRDDNLNCRLFLSDNWQKLKEKWGVK